MRRALTLWAALLGLMLAAGPAAAVQRALLVGVSELASQPAALWLQAPRNDVLLMRSALQQQGFAAADIAVVADGVPGAALPDARGIHDALARLLAQSRSGDFVLLYFSGHGTRVRDTAKRYQEPDGLAENFLARDARGAMTAGAALSGGVRDVEIDGWVRAFLARNVFVWAVFDTCSAQSMTRSLRTLAPQAAGTGSDDDDEVRWRGVRVDQLARAAAAAGAEADAPAPPADAGAASVPRARYVAFFASESHQVTPELRLPRGERRAQAQGLLTWALVGALRRQPGTWRELFDGVLAQYPGVIDELAQRFPDREMPSPVAEGNLDAPMFANPQAPASTRPVWRAERSGGRLSVQAGLMDGLFAGQSLRVQAQQEDGTVRSAIAAIEQIELGRARLAVPAPLRDDPGTVAWSAAPLQPPTALALRVAAAQGLPGGLSLDYPASVQGAERAQADVTVEPLAGGGASLRLAPALQWGPAALEVPASDAALREQLQALARFKWLQQLAGLGSALRLDGFDADLERWRGEQLLQAVPLREAGALAAPQADERFMLAVRNTSGRSLDLVVLGVDARAGLRAVYPSASAEANRFERGTAEQPAAKRFELPWLAQPGSRLLVLATPAQPLSAPRLFGAGVASHLPELRLRGQPNPELERQAYAAMFGWGGLRAAPSIP
ncbi:MAG: caspase family protein [Comamonadaceae bacterium]|nr:MAG: caspase family protein [Comamonadaceae bacterium]